MLDFLTTVFTFIAIFSFIAAVIYVVIIVISDADLLLTCVAKFGKQPVHLARKVVWITGASSGIGEHIALELAQAGCHLVLSARRKEELDRVKEACLDRVRNVSVHHVTDDDIMVVPLDVRHFDTHNDAVIKVLQHFSKIDVLVNNAGLGQRAAWMDVQLAVDRDMFELNVLGHVSLTQAVLPHMLDRGQGHIVVMSSLAGKFGVPMSRSYTGTKYALQGYFECLRTEVAQHNIDVTIICPGPVFSNLFIPAATGTPGEKLGRPMVKTEKRMTTSRCAYLSCVAITNRLYEVWMSRQPILILVYLNQYFPDTARWFTKSFGLKQIMKMREGN